MADIWVGTDAADVLSALSAATNSDRVILPKNYTENHTTKPTFDVAAGVTNPIPVIGVNETAKTANWTQMVCSSSGPPAGMPAITTSGVGIGWTAQVWWRGTRFVIESWSTIGGSTNGPIDGEERWDDCELEFTSANTSGFRILTYATLRMTRSWININGVSYRGFSPDGYRGGIVAIGGGLRNPTGIGLMDPSSNRIQHARFTGFDFAGGVPVFDRSDWADYRVHLDSCDLTGTPNPTQGGGSGMYPGSYVRCTACRDAAGSLPLWEVRREGEAKSDSTTRTGGGLVTRYTSNANASIETPLESNLCAVQLDTTAQRTLTIYLATPSGTTLSAGDVLATVAYSGGLAGDTARDAAAGGALVSDTSTWSLAAGYTAYKMTVTVPASALGAVDEVAVVNVLLNKASATAYVDTLIGVA